MNLLVVMISLLVVVSPTVSDTVDTFTCTKKGRFIDETDTDCKRYFLCSQKKSGKWVKTTFYCPETSNFDSTLGICASEATCAYATTTPTTEVQTTINIETTEIQTTTNLETTENPIPPSNTNYTCDTEGRFPDKSACDCGWFYECKLYQNNLFSTRLYCPPNTKFDPKVSACSKSYQCVKEFVCKAEGLFPINELDNKSYNSYYSCKQMEDGSFFQIELQCPNDMIFDPKLKLCTEQETESTTIDELTTYETTHDTTDVNNLTSSSSTHSTTSTNLFQCTNSGRFRDPQDDICKGYFLCIDLQAFHFNCPIDMKFNPDIQECQNDYKCPYDSVTEKWASTFHCQKRGYFKNYNEVASKSYHFCDVLGDGTIYQYELVCPSEYYFDENTNLCKQIK